MFFSYIFNCIRDNTSNQKKKKERTKNSTDSDNLVLKIDPTNSQEASETDFDATKYKRKEPNYYNYLIDELSIKQSNKKIKTFAILNSIAVKKDTATLTTSFNDVTAKFELTEDFFTDVNKEQTIIFLLDIIEYSKTDKVLLETLSESHNIDEKNITLYVHNSKNIAFFIDNKLFTKIPHAVSYVNHNKNNMV